MIKQIITIFIVTLSSLIYGQELTKVDYTSYLQSMTLHEKIGQLFMVRSSSTYDVYEKRKLDELIDKYHIGGICFFQGNITDQLRLTNSYQTKSKLPLLIAIDGEWGLGMRHPKSTISYPRQLMLGAIQNNNLIYEMGKDIAAQCKRIGVNVNFAPVIDVNNNIDNPVINDRSFGEDKINVAAKGYAYMQGMQEEGVMACAKHFPGHGDTNVDSHYDLPIITHSKHRLNDLELFPFKTLSNTGVGSMMVAHLHIPAYDSRPNRATTLSRSAVTGILRNQLNYQGLIFTDAMEMKGVTKHFKPGEADAEAFLAGNDIILLPLDVPKAIQSIKDYLNQGLITEDRIDSSVYRILKAKTDYQWKAPRGQDLKGDLNKNQYLALRSKLVENAITIATNQDNLIPLIDVNKKYLSIALGVSGISPFQKRLNSYAGFEHISIPSTVDEKTFANTVYKAKKKDVVIISIHGMKRSRKSNFGISDDQLKLIREISQRDNVLLVLFGSPYSLIHFDDNKNIVVAYEDTEMTQDITAQSLFGANAILGKLPVGVSKKYYLNKGITTPSLGRIGYASPESVGMSSDTLKKIDLTVDSLINDRAAPGCQVVIARKGKIVYQKSYGHFTYDNIKTVKNDNVYDLASITKIMASTLSMIKLTSEQKIDINLPLNTYYPPADTSNKNSITLKSMMSHHARLRPWIPFYKSTVEEKPSLRGPSINYYRRQLSDGYEIPVAENLFLRTDYRDSIWSQILASPLRESEGYRYSDLGFYLASACIENKCNVGLDEYTMATFYKPLGLRRTGFNPLNWIPKESIVPTEKDDYFRHKILQGEVHDMGAAMLGGVSGHAGLFSTGEELAVLSQLFLNKGEYGGKKYFSYQALQEFTTRYPTSTRRGIGFDMKELDPNKTENMSHLASDKVFGHYGFTGTAVFIDPEYDLIYIFLSNRTYPSMKNNKLNRDNYRSKIQTLAYKAIIDNV